MASSHMRSCVGHRSCPEQQEDCPYCHEKSKCRHRGTKEALYPGCSQLLFPCILDFDQSFFDRLHELLVFSLAPNALIQNMSANYFIENDAVV